MPTNNVFQILLVTRSVNQKQTDITLSKHITSRIYSNLEEIKDMLSQLIVSNLNVNRKIILIIKDILSFPFDEQIQLVANSSIVIGMHGAGIAHTIAMPIGTKYCCGVVEIFPEGEYKQSYRGFGNMARGMGHIYERLDLLTDSSTNTTDSLGTKIPIKTLSKVVQKMINGIDMKSSGSCFQTNVISNPFL